MSLRRRPLCGYVRAGGFFYFTHGELVVVLIEKGALEKSHVEPFRERCYDMRMLTEYIQKKMGTARYKILEDGTYFGDIPSVRGVWANSDTLEKCRNELQEVLEEWLLLSVRTGAPTPGLPTIKSKRSVATYA